MPKSVSLPIYDVIGVGFGPSNMALAIALEELSHIHGKTLNSLFLDKQAQYSWHGETLVTQSELQISFLKDLVSLRNPTSPYSFINYLHQHDRLIDFINLGTFYPCRMEFSDYLRWVASHFNEQVRYGEEVTAIEPILENGEVRQLCVYSTDAQGQSIVRQARSVIVSTGGTPKIPEMFQFFRNEPRIFHHSQYISRTRELLGDPQATAHIAIIGSGQSAAEAFIDLHDSYPNVKADMLLRASALKPADDSPFVNEIFAPEQTEAFFKQDEQQRQSIINEYHNTNYSVVDLDLIERIYAILYRQKVSRQFRHHVLCQQQVEAVKVTDQGIELSLLDRTSNQPHLRRYDAVILATGYQRNNHQKLLSSLEEYLQDYRVDRFYRAQADSTLKAPVYLQGFCENSHGLSDTLLSVLANRAEEVAISLYRSLGITQQETSQQKQQEPSLVS